jgi:hypothetical protein
LLIFAITYGILVATSAFGGKKQIHLIIALVVGLFAIRLPFARVFMQEAFSNLGVALAALATIWILVAMFLPNDTDKKKSIQNWVFLGVGAIAVIVVLFNSFNYLGWLSFWGAWEEWVALVIGLGVIGAIIYFITRSSPT